MMAFKFCTIVWKNVILQYSEIVFTFFEFLSILVSIQMIPCRERTQSIFEKKENLLAKHCNSITDTSIII